MDLPVEVLVGIPEEVLDLHPREIERPLVARLPQRRGELVLVHVAFPLDIVVLENVLEGLEHVLHVRVVRLQVALDVVHRTVRQATPRRRVGAPDGRVRVWPHPSAAARRDVLDLPHADGLDEVVVGDLRPLLRVDPQRPYEHVHDLVRDTVAEVEHLQRLDEVLPLQGPRIGRVQLLEVVADRVAALLVDLLLQGRDGRVELLRALLFGRADVAPREVELPPPVEVGHLRAGLTEKRCLRAPRGGALHTVDVVYLMVSVRERLGREADVRLHTL